uniref:Glutathione S-Transferase n=1 Tax=Schistosoma japonicum TaxID=6182 RepID=C1LY31_SCHJA|nr:Glutathione S-Transferase [Schistosoma japonicum]
MACGHVKLIYFNGRGRAEPIRMILVAAGVEFEDERIEFQDWPKIKPTIPGGRLPIVKITDKRGDVKMMSESLAIARFIARKHNMMGDTDDEYYIIEKMIGQVEDVESEYHKTLMKPPEEKEKISKEILNGKVPILLQAICETLKESTGNLTVGDKVTLADVVLIASIDHITDLDKEFLTGKYPEIHKHRKHLLAPSPKLAKYLSERHATAF